LRLNRETMESLAHYKSVRGMTSWEEAVESLLAKSKVIT
jgi:hypothetical protein